MPELGQSIFLHLHALCQPFAAFRMALLPWIPSERLVRVGMGVLPRLLKLTHHGQVLPPSSLDRLDGSAIREGAERFDKLGTPMNTGGPVKGDGRGEDHCEGRSVT